MEGVEGWARCQGLTEGDIVKEEYVLTMSRIPLKNLDLGISLSGEKDVKSENSLVVGEKTEKETVDWPITDWGPDVVAEIAGTTFG
jgi:hypothetical protein